MIRVAENGTDAPQCLYNHFGNWTTPEGMACASLNYAFSHIKNNTYYFIDCGTYPLHPFQGNTPFWQLENIQIHSMCPGEFSVIIVCTAENNLLFHQITALTIVGVTIRNCGPGEPVEGVPIRPSSLYFHACRDVILVDVGVDNSSGRCIAFYNTMGTNRVSFMVAHCKGSGVYFEFTGCPEHNSASDPTCERAQFIIHRVKLHCCSGTSSCHADTLPTKSNPFEGLGGGVSIIFRGNARGNNISFIGNFTSFSNRAAISGGGMFIGHFDHSSENVVLSNFESQKYLKSIIVFRDNEVTGTNASLTIANESCLNACLGVGGGVSVVFCGMSNSNNVALMRSFNSRYNFAPLIGGGVSIIFHGNARGNNISFTGDFTLESNRAVISGGGMFIGHFDHSSDNVVLSNFESQYLNSFILFRDNEVTGANASLTIANGSCLNACLGAGGGVSVVFCGMSNNNNVTLLGSFISGYNFAPIGGGVSIIFHGNAHGNNISFIGNFTSSSNRAAISGGGIFIGHFDHSSENVVLSNFESQKYLKSFIMFSENKVTGTNTSITIANESCLNACLGVGGGVSVVFCGMSSNNNVTLLGSFISGYNFAPIGGGVSIIFHGNARGNNISFIGNFTSGFNQAAISGGGMFIGHFDHSSENVVLSNFESQKYLKSSILFSDNAVTGTNASLTIANESCLNACLGVGGGVSVVFCGMSNNNNVTLLGSFISQYNFAPLGGGGMFIGHFNNSSRNTVTLGESTIVRWIGPVLTYSIFIGNSVFRAGVEQYFKNMYRFMLCGGGLLVYHCDQSHSSQLNMISSFGGNIAEAGGGMCAIFKDNSSRHQVYQLFTYFNDSFLHSGTSDKGDTRFKGCGGAMLVVFQSSAYMNNVTINTLPTNNTAFTAGGCLFVGFCEKAHNNTINVNALTCVNNTVDARPGKVDGRGGGISIVFSDEASHNMLIGYNWYLYNNSADYGGGVHIKLKKLALNNGVYINNSFIALNHLLHQKTFSNSTTTKHGGGGGGIHIEFYTDWKYWQTSTSNIVNLTQCILLFNTAKGLVGGGISVIDWRNSADVLELSFCTFLHNVASYGAAISIEMFPSYQVGNSTTHRVILGPNNRFYGNFSTWNPDHSWIKEYTTTRSIWENSTNFNDFPVMDIFITRVQGMAANLSASLDELLSLIQRVNFDVQYRIKLESTGNGLVYLKSTRVAVKGEQAFVCMEGAQGMFAVDSVLFLDSGANMKFFYCVATHGGAMALYSDSTIVLSERVQLSFIQNYALQHGGAIYVDVSYGPHTSAQNCFLQYHSQENATFSPQLWENVGISFINNSAGQEGNSVYISDALTCMPSLTDHDVVGGVYLVNSTEVLKWSNVFHYIPQGCSVYNTSCDLSEEVASGPSSIQCRAEVNVNGLATFTVIPGKETQLPVDGVLDDYDNKIQSVFSVQLLNPHGALNLSVDPFSRYTSDFKVILRGIPKTYILHLSNHFPASTRNATAADSPQLFLQSVENEKLVLAGNVELQCCPAGYSLDLEQLKCLCLDKSIPAITNCNSTSLQANLAGNYWIGYLPSQGVGSCDGQRLYYSLCPPGFCRPELTQLPPNNSAEELNKVVCSAGRRSGVLCGDCAAGHSATVNFGALSPNCVDCSETLSVVGVLIWIVSEWVPLTIMLVVVLLVNVDLLSGHMNSFLLFAQILSLSFMRANTASSPAYVSMAKIPKFLYGFWNLNYFGVFLPPYCLTPHAHLTTMQVLMLQCTIGLFPLLMVFTLVALEKCSDKYWRLLVCPPIRKCLARLRGLKSKVSGSPSYDRALSTFFVLGYTRFLVVSAYILVKVSIISTSGDVKDVVWWQGTIEYASVNHIAFMIPSLIILVSLVIVPTFVLLAVPVLPQLYGRMRYSTNGQLHCLRKCKVFDYLCLDIFTGKWIRHFINVFQGCFKDRFRFFAGMFLLYRIAQLMATLLPTRVEDSFIIQIALCLAYMLLLTACQPYHRKLFNIVDILILGDLALILLLDLKLAYATPGDGLVAVIVIQQALMYLPLVYLFGLLGTMAYQKCKKRRAAAREETEMERPSLENVEEDDPARLQLIEYYRSITHLRPPSKGDEFTSEEEDEDSSEESDDEMHSLA